MSGVSPIGDTIKTERDRGAGRAPNRRSVAPIPGPGTPTAMSSPWITEALASIGQGLIIWDAEDRVAAWNERVFQIFPHLRDVIAPGVPASTAFARAIAAAEPHLSPEQQAAWVAERLAQRRRGGIVELLPPDGRVIEISEQRTPSGGFVSMYTDVTAIRGTERALRESEARFRDGIASMAEGFTMWNAAGRLVAWNQRYIEIIPDAADIVAPGIAFEALNETLLARRHPDIGADQRASLLAQRIARRRNPGPAFEMLLPDGRTIEITERPTADGGCVAVHRDITQRRSEQIELERALAAEREMNLLQRRFISIASHEFRTPLAIILSAIQRIETRLLDAIPPETALRFQRIHGAIGRMNDMIERMLSSARADEGRLTPQPQPLDVVALVREAIHRQVTITPKIEITLRSSIESAIIAADPDLLDQVFANLLSNATKYSGNSHAIVVTVAGTDTELSVSVTDFGIGIAADDLPRLFSRFFRARSAEGIAGTGIGLHLVRTLVEAHGGRIAVESEIGRGSTFTVYLQAAGPAAAAA